jgi:N,N-dimethylformamidase
MLIGYVSDEQYLAVADALLEFEQEGRSVVAVARSSPRGAVFAEIPAGEYRVTLVKPGFGSKRVSVRVEEGRSYQFRLLSDRLLGYAWPKWVRSGERSEFRVHAVEPYRLSVWRYGLTKEFVRLLGWFDEHGPRAVMQITPDGDYTQTGVRWNTVGYTSPHHTQFMVAPERSGLYYFHAKGESGAFFSFPWVVAPARPQAPIAVLACANTWNAYNNFGGRSNYINPNGLPPEPTVNARQDLLRYAPQGSLGVWRFPDGAYPPLSWDRPEIGNHVPEQARVTDPIEGRLASAQAPGEWRLLAWLEREGLAYDYYAEPQLHTGELDLDAYRVLILPVHPEYWSRRMYERVKAWVHERGGRLMYLAGNGLNCEVEFVDGATLRFKTHLASEGGSLGMRDPERPDHYFESRFHRTVESEANLLGVVCSESGIMTAAPYRVVDAAHWALAGTGLREGDVFGTASLHERVHGGASGHETDKMSPSSPPGTRLLAKGLNPDEGGAEMVYYETASGGAVFSVGSITYVSCLLVDVNVSRITRNVITRFLEAR